MPVKFIIEYLFNNEKLDSYLIARCLSNPIDFFLTENSFLNGIEIKNELNQPRSLFEGGEPRFDLFIFKPKRNNAFEELKEGQILIFTPRDELQYLIPWYKTDQDLSDQLMKEVSKDHILYNKRVKTLARRQDNDDVLFEVLTADFKYAMVHLTWGNKVQTTSYWPQTIVFRIRTMYMST